MRKIANFSVAIVIGLVSISGYSQTYGELGYSNLTYEEIYDGDGIKSSASAIRGFLGFEISPNLAVEGMAAFGLSEGSVKFNGQTVPGAKLEMNNAIGLYIKPKVRLSGEVELFGRLGFARVKGTAAAPGVGTERLSESSVSYGAGISYSINSTTSLVGDYMQYLSKDGAKVNGFTLGVGLKF